MLVQTVVMANTSKNVQNDFQDLLYVKNKTKKLMNNTRNNQMLVITTMLTLKIVSNNFTIKNENK